MGDKPKRKPLSKKIRYEVFKKDKFTCQYCGRSAPDVVLHVDHIIPVAKGGTNDILNLVTSCSDCNLGKGARTLDDNSVVKKQQARIQELAEKNEQLEMMLSWREELQKLSDKEIEAADNRISEITGGMSASDHGKRILKQLIRKYTLNMVLDAIDIAFERYFDGSEEGCECAFNKIGGVCYNLEHEDNKQTYYFNYLRKCLRNTYRYYNEKQLKRFVDIHVVTEEDFQIVKNVFKTNKNWSDFTAELGEIYGNGDL